MLCTQSAALVASGLLFLVPCGGQAPESPSAYEVLANQMEVLRGESKELWLLDQHGAVLRSPALTRERPESPTAGTVSVAALRHEVPKAARKAFERGLKASAKANHLDAVKGLEQAVALDPEFADAHNRLGVEYGQMGRPEEAEREFRQALRLDPASWTGHHNLGVLLFRKGDLAGAEQSARRALQLSGGAPEVQALLGWLLSLRTEMRSEALRYLESAAQTLPAARRALEDLRGR